jgi:hypothetical protein
MSEASGRGIEIMTASFLLVSVPLAFALLLIVAGALTGELEPSTVVVATLAGNVGNKAGAAVLFFGACPAAAGVAAVGAGGNDEGNVGKVRAGAELG